MHNLGYLKRHFKKYGSITERENNNKDALTECPGALNYVAGPTNTVKKWCLCPNNVRLYKSFHSDGRRRSEIHENNRTQPQRGYWGCDNFISFLSFPQPSCVFIVSTAPETGKDKRRQRCILAFIHLDGKFLKLLTEVPGLFVKCIHFLPIPQK